MSHASMHTNKIDELLRDRAKHTAVTYSLVQIASGGI